MRRSVLLFGLLGFLVAGLPAAGKAFAAEPYRMIFRGYSAEVLRGVEEYIAEFPFYAGHQLIVEGPQGAEYEYRSGAEASEIAASLGRMFPYLDIEGGVDVEARRITVTQPDYTEPPTIPETVEQESLQPSPEGTAVEKADTRTALQTPQAQPPKANPDPVLPPVPASRPLTLRLTTERGDRPTFSIGENFDLTVELSRDAWMYCYYRQVDGSVVKLFPNPQRDEARLKGGIAHRIPGDIYPFELAFSEPPGEEMLTCYATARDVAAELPVLLRTPDFGTLPDGMETRLHDIFEGLKDTEVAHDSLSIEVTR